MDEGRGIGKGDDGVSQGQKQGKAISIGKREIG